MALLEGACIAGSDKSHPISKPVQPSVVTARTEDGRTVLDVHSAAGKTYSVTVDRDSTVARESPPAGATVVGELSERTVVVIDNYPSVALGMSYCGAGVERFLRVLSISAAPPTETYRLKLASCRESIELAADSIAWQADSAALHVHWLIGPGATHGEQVTTLRIGSDGKTRTTVR